MSTYYCTMDSPIGELLLLGDGEHLTGLYMATRRHPPRGVDGARRDAAAFSAALEQLRAYFAGELRDFSVPLAAAGTPFQRQVWQALEQIPYGTTLSYGELAGRIGRPGAARAVGLANGRNPISIIVPCHRVVGANGTLTGYAGGLDRKQWLLAHESRLSPSEESATRAVTAGAAHRW